MFSISAFGGTVSQTDPTQKKSSSAISSSNSSVLSSNSSSRKSRKSSSSSSSYVLPRLHISGNQLLDQNNAPVKLRGWNWGRWGLVQPTDADDNKNQHATITRIPLRWWGYYDGRDIDSRDDAQTNTAGIDADHLQVLDDAITQAVKAGSWVILFIDSDCGQNGLQDPDTSAYCNKDNDVNDPNQEKYKKYGHNFWTDPVARAKFINVWKYVANKYKDMPYIAMFEPLPEPDPKSANAADINAFYDEVMTAIRSVAPGIPFILGARAYHIEMVQNAYNSSWTDVVYTGDLFVKPKDTPENTIAALRERLDSLLWIRDNNLAPIFVQQTGVKSGEEPSSDLPYLNGLLTLLNTKQVGYTYWMYRDTLNPDAYGVIYQDGKGGWKTKDDFLNTISGYFNEPW